MKSKILKRNAAYQQQVEQLLAQLTDSDDTILNMAAMDGGWSAIQVVHHLILIEEFSLQYVRKKLSFNPKLEIPGPDSWVRLQLLKTYLKTSFKFKAPENVSDKNLPGFTSLAETKKRWLAIRQEWTKFLEDLPDDLLDKAVYKHPFAGRFGWLGMLKFFQYHFERHQKQIYRTMGFDTANKKAVL